MYGTTLKALVHEKFGDGIISAINFKLDVKKVADPEGGERAVITLDGKYLPTKTVLTAMRNHQKTFTILLVLVLIGLNMRPLLTSVGPLLPQLPASGMRL